jgi:hypothetical protein
VPPTAGSPGSRTGDDGERFDVVPASASRQRGQRRGQRHDADDQTVLMVKPSSHW